MNIKYAADGNRMTIETCRPHIYKRLAVLCGSDAHVATAALAASLFTIVMFYGHSRQTKAARSAASGLACS